MGFLKYIWTNREKRGLFTLIAIYGTIALLVASNEDYIPETVSILAIVLGVALYGSWQNYKGRSA